MSIFGSINGSPIMPRAASAIYRPSKKALQAIGLKESLDFSELRRIAQAAIKSGRIKEPEKKPCRCGQLITDPSMSVCTDCYRDREAKGLLRREFKVKSTGQCKVCGESFGRLFAHQNMCSDACRKKRSARYYAEIVKPGRKKPWMTEERKCRICSKGFNAWRINQVTCGDENCMSINRNIIRKGKKGK
jgi:hypothetical protein